MNYWKQDTSWQEDDHKYSVYSFRTDEVCIHDSLAAIWLLDGKVTDARISKSKWEYGYEAIFSVDGMTLEEAKAYLETMLRLEKKI